MHLMGLLVRSRLLKSLAVIVLVTSFAATMLLGISAALDLSPSQRADRAMGAASALVEPFNREQAPPGTTPEIPAWLETAPEVAVFPELSSVVNVQREGEVKSLAYAEVELPSPATHGRLVLQSGSWPAIPGDCVTSSADAVGSWFATAGHWELNITGLVQDKYFPTSESLWCAPGTWSGWDVSEISSFQSSAAVARYFLVGDQSELDALTATAILAGDLVPAEVLFRQTVLEGQGVSPQRFLALYSLIAVVVTGFPFIFSGTLVRWVTGIQQLLTRAGIEPRVIRAATFVSSAAASTFGGVIGSSTGMLVSGIAYPIVSAFNSGVPLKPWQFRWDWVLLIAVAGVVGAVIGFMVLDRTTRLKARADSRPAEALPKRTAGVLRWIAMALGLVAGVSLLTSAGRIWPMSIGAVLGALACAFIAPTVLEMAQSFLTTRGGTTPRDLAVRLMAEDGKRWAGVVMAMTAVAGIVVTVLVNISATVTAQMALMQSPVPRGTALVEVRSPAGIDAPSEVLTQLEADVGVKHVARMTDSLYGPPGEGLVQTFESLDDAIAALGHLEAGVSAALADGQIIKPGARDETVQLRDVTNSLEAVERQVVGYSPPPESLLNTGFGFALATALPIREADAPTSVWWVYTGLSPGEEARLLGWPAKSGNGALLVRGYVAPSGGGVPVWLAIGFGGLALATVPIFLWVLRREVRSLRGVTSSLHSAGLSPAWVGAVLATICLCVVLVPLSLALVSGLASTIILHLLYPSVFALEAINWFGLGAFGTVLLGAALASALEVTRRLRRREKSVVV